MKSKATLFMPAVVLDRTAAMPLHHQIERAIRQAIRNGAVVHNARLPSTRVMAKLLGVSRNTVLAAYDSLAADGLIEGERGLGMRVRKSASSPEPTWFGLRQVIRESGFPAQVLPFEDPEPEAKAAGLVKIEK